MLRKRLLLLFGAVTLASGLTYTPSQAADFCTRLEHCRSQRGNCQFNCGQDFDHWAQCLDRCDRLYERCCTHY